MTEETAKHLARDWIAAWNAHNLDSILDHYADEIEFTSPLVPKLAGIASGTLVGKPALRDYFRKGLEAYPELHFALKQVLVGVRSVTLSYRSVNGLDAAEVLTLNQAGKILRAMVHYSPANPADETGFNDSVNEWTRDGYVVTDDAAQSDLDAICALLQSTYWADDRSREVIATSLRHSECLHLLHGGRQVGLIRGVTDRATFTWVCDVIVDPAHRGRGLGRWLVECFLAHPRLQTISQHLCTKDAHGLYEQFGFQRIEAMRRSSRPMPFLLRAPSPSE
jgi:GNAT superfamily N-acetyltransferase